VAEKGGIFIKAQEIHSNNTDFNSLSQTSERILLMSLFPYLLNRLDSLLWGSYLGTVWKDTILQIKGGSPAG